MDRRAFVSALGGLTFSSALPLAAATNAVKDVNRSVAGDSPDDVALNESYWLRVRQAFAIDANHVNLNSGTVSPSPRVVGDAVQRYWTITNMSPSLYVEELLYPEIELVRRRLAAMFGCDPGELAMTRNTSESLQIVQMGYPLAAGDEIVTTTQDYPRMIKIGRAHV